MEKLRLLAAASWPAASALAAQQQHSIDEEHTETEDSKKHKSLNYGMENLSDTTDTFQLNWSRKPHLQCGIYVRTHMALHISRNTIIMSTSRQPLQPTRVRIFTTAGIYCLENSVPVTLHGFNFMT